MQELIFIIILAVFIGGMLWSDRDSRKTEVFKFIGFDADRYYSGGLFTIGKIYTPIDGTLNRYINDVRHAEARFTDDRQLKMYEELRYFKEIK